MIKLVCIKSDGYTKGQNYTLIDIIDTDNNTIVAVIDKTGMIYPYREDDFVPVEEWRTAILNKIFND